MNRKILSLFLSGAMTLSMAAPALAAESKSFSDVADKAWYAPAVTYVAEKGLMAGIGADRFAPSGTVTRATVFQTLYNLAGKPETGETSFGDVAGKWYATAAAWAESESLAAVPADKTFAGERAITRAETAVILSRYAQQKGIQGGEGGMAMREAPDYDQIPAWALEGMSFCYYADVMKGDSKGNLKPNGSTQRAELAQILMQFTMLKSSYTSQAVTVTNGKREVPAVVTLPVGEGPFAAVVINHGHGGNKDEGGGFAGVAQALAKAGIASIRMDFPGCGDSKEPFTENTLSNMISDSNACKDYLVANYPVNKDKLGILGYSMGGRLALEVLSAKGNPYGAAVILSGASAPGLESIKGLLPTGTTYEQALAAAKKDGAFQYTTQYGQKLALSEQWFTDMMVDPLAAIKNYTGPMLVLHGDKDDVVTDAVNKGTVKAYPSAVEVVVPDADHGYGFYSDQPAVTAAVQGSISGFFTQHLLGEVKGTVSAVEKYGNLDLNLDPNALLAAGYAYGDVLSVTVGDQTLEIPFCTAYSDVNTGELVVRHNVGSNLIVIAINMGNFAKTYGVGVGDSVTIRMAEKAGYLGMYQAHQLERTNVRGDYASDEAFANFRPIEMGSIAKGVLYRTSSPVNPELGRAAYADNLIEKAGVATVLNLADSKDEIAGYFAAEGFDSPYYKGLYEAGNVIALNMGVDYKADEFKAQLKSGLEFMLAHKGPYAFHCTEGKDRAGFIAILLESLMGGKKDEIVADYMVSYENYYHVKKDSEQYKLIAQVAEGMLRDMAGLAKDADLSKVNLVKAAESYLTGIGLSADQVTALKTTLSTPVTAEKAA